MNHVNVFDRTVCDTLVAELGAEDVAEVLGGFFADTAGKLQRLSAHGLDGLEIRREAHSIKSSAATFGFLGLSQQAKQLETDALAMSAEALHGAIEELRNSFMLVRRLADVLLPVDIREIAK